MARNHVFDCGMSVVLIKNDDDDDDDDRKAKQSKGSSDEGACRSLYASQA